MPDDVNGYLRLAEAAVKAAREAGASHAEAVAGWSRAIGVEVEKSSVRSADAGHGESLALRALVNGAAGFLNVEGLEGIDPAAVGAECARMAAAATPDPAFVDLPHPDPAPEVEGLYDDAVAHFSVADAVRVAVANIEEARTVDPQVLLAGDVGIEVSAGALVNSNGVALTRRGSVIQVGFHAVIRRGDDVGSYHDFDVGRNLADVTLNGLGRGVTEQALRFLGARKVETGRRDLVLGPLAAVGFLQSVMAAASAEAVQRGRSFLVGRLGQRIAAPCLTAIDDPLAPRGLRSGSHDGEGTRRARRAIIERGVLTTYLHNSYTAHKAGVASTGHGTPGGGIAAANLQVNLGDRSAAQLIADVQDGIYVNPGSISADPTSGDVSAAIDFGLRIERGALTHPVLTCLVGGTIWELLDHLDAVSADYRAEPGNIWPTLRIRDILVAGGDA